MCLGGETRLGDWRVERCWLGMFGRKLYQVGGGGGILRCSASSALHNRKTEKLKTCKSFDIFKMYDLDPGFHKTASIRLICLNIITSKFNSPAPFPLFFHSALVVEGITGRGPGLL